MVDEVKYGNTAALREYMLKGNRVSRIESLIIFGVQNFTAVLSTFKNDGFIIKKEVVTMARIIRRTNQFITLSSPKDLPTKDILMSEWWISE